jgi:Ribosome biogenesis protein Nop16
LKHLWDPSQTPTANLTNLGLVAHPNKKVSGGAGCTHTSDGANETSNSSVTDNSTIIELFDVPESDGFTRNNLRTKFPLDVEEEKYVVKCMGKYGDNYTSMFRDIKINNMQHTEEKLRKLCTRYILLTNEQRRVDIPENVQNIIDKLQ